MPLLAIMPSCNSAYSNTVCCYEQLVLYNVDQTPAGPYAKEKKRAATEKTNVGANNK